MHERNYNQNCALARASDLLGERWTLLIVRDLLVAPRRFSELEQRLKGMGTNLLSQRLKDMRAAGLINDGESRTPYVLTEMGRALEPMILQLVRWSLHWVRGTPNPDGLHWPDWDLLALKSLFAPDPKMKKPLLARFVSGNWRAWVQINSVEYQCGLGEPNETPDIEFSCSIPALRSPVGVVSKMNKPMREKAERFAACFPIG